MKLNRILAILLLLLVSAPAWSQSLEFRAYMKAGQQAYSRGQYSEALRQYRLAEGVTQNGDPAAARREINKCQNKLAEARRQANAANEAAQKKQREEAERIYALAKEQYSHSNFEDAKENFSKVTSFFPEAQALMQQCDEEIIRSKGFMEVTDIQFATGDPIMGMMTGYGEPIFASDLNDDQKIIANIVYTPLDKEPHKVTLRFRITDEKGNLVVDPAAPFSGSTTTWDNRVINEKGNLKGYFYNEFAPGTYNCELSINGKTLISKPLVVSRKPGEASFLTVNDETTVYATIPPEGGVNTFVVNTDADKYEIVRTTTNIDQRSDISQNGNTITVKTRPNYTFYTIETKLTIVAGGRNVRINLTQEATNVLTAGDWLEQLNRVISAGTEHTRTIVYKGEDWESRSHYTIMHWENADMWYIGLASRRNEERLYGMYLTGVPDHQSIFNFTSFYVGEYTKNQMTEGACYDRMGNLIYRGEFKGNMPFPASAYPAQSAFYPSDGDIAHRFDYLVEENGHAYLGETNNGVKEGFGIYFYDNGNCWVGTWKNNVSVEGAFIDLSGYGVKRNKCEDNR